VEAPFDAEGTRLDVEMTVEATRHFGSHFVGATVVKTPSFNSPRKTATAASLIVWSG